jgi:hypothetical protein
VNLAPLSQIQTSKAMLIRLEISQTKLLQTASLNGGPLLESGIVRVRSLVEGGKFTQPELQELKSLLDRCDRELEELLSVKLTAEKIHDLANLNEMSLLNSIVVLSQNNAGGIVSKSASVCSRYGVFYLDIKKDLTASTTDFDFSLEPCQIKEKEHYRNEVYCQQGFTETLDGAFLSDLTGDLKLNVPGNLSFEHNGKSYSLNGQFMVDICRFSAVYLNSSVLLDKQKGIESISPLQIFDKLLKALEGDVPLTIRLTTLLTQASLARPTELLIRKWSNPGLQHSVSAAAFTGVEVFICNQIIVQMKAVFPWTDYSDEMKTLGYFTVVRTMILPIKENGCNSKVIDTYLPLFFELEDAIKCKVAFPKDPGMVVTYQNEPIGSSCTLF